MREPWSSRIWLRSASGTLATIALLIGSSACTNDDNPRETKQRATHVHDAASATQLDAGGADQSEPGDQRSTSSSERETAPSGVVPSADGGTSQGAVPGDETPDSDDAPASDNTVPADTGNSDDSRDGSVETGSVTSTGVVADAGPNDDTLVLPFTEPDELPPDAAAPDSSGANGNWSGELPESCEVASNGWTNSCYEVFTCGDSQTSVICRPDVNGWECDVGILTLVEGSFALEIKAIYSIAGTFDETNVCGFSAALALAGGPAAVSKMEADCTPFTSSDANTCHREIGCRYSVALPAQELTIWEASAPDVDCNATESAIECTCHDSSRETSRSFELTSGSPADGCESVGDYCATVPSLPFDADTVCDPPEVAQDGAWLCATYARCETVVLLPSGTTAIQVTSRDLVCTGQLEVPELDWSCRCNRELGWDTLDLGLTSSTDACATQSERCFAPSSVQRSDAPRDCWYEASLRSGQCVAVMHCATPVEVDGASATVSHGGTLECEQDSTGGLDCLCPTLADSMDPFSVDSGVDLDATCVAAVTQCEERLEDGPL